MYAAGFEKRQTKRKFRKAEQLTRVETPSIRQQNSIFSISIYVTFLPEKSKVQLELEMRIVTGERVMQ